MKSNIALLFFILLHVMSVIAQPNKQWLQDWQKMTVSIGNVKYDTSFKDGKKILHPYYNILGTGVVFYLKNSEFPEVVTAMHVLQDEKGNFLDSVKIRFSWEDSKSVYDFFGHNMLLKYHDTSIVYTHPAKQMDLACFPLALRKSDRLTDTVKMVRYDFFAQAEDYSEGNDVYVLGYPGSVGKTYWTRALIRKGVISWIPKDDIGEKKFLIDANVYPGNSGGPVITQIPVIQFRDTTDQDLIKDYRFLGIVIERRFDYNRITTSQNKEVIDSAGKVITKSKKNKTVTNSPDDFLYSKESIGVAVVEPAENVLSLLRSLDNAIKSIRK